MRGESRHKAFGFIVWRSGRFTRNFFLEAGFESESNPLPAPKRERDSHPRDMGGDSKDSSPSFISLAFQKAAPAESKCAEKLRFNLPNLGCAVTNESCTQPGETERCRYFSACVTADSNSLGGPRPSWRKTILPWRSITNVVGNAAT
jgi:hypothetical protein